MDKKLATITFTLFLFCAVVLVLFAVNGPLKSQVSASSSPDASFTNSLLLAFPLTIKPDGIDKSKIDVFATSQSGTPSKGKTIKLTSNLGQIEPATAVTNEVGQATFYLKSTTAGEANIELYIDGQKFPQTALVTIAQ